MFKDCKVLFPSDSAVIVKHIGYEGSHRTLNVLLHDLVKLQSFINTNCRLSVVRDHLLFKGSEATDLR